MKTFSEWKQSLIFENENLEKKAKLFGSEAERVTSKELMLIFNELKALLSDGFSHFIPVKSLESKEDHGDIDILVAPPRDINLFLKERLGNRLIKFSKNDTVNSFLYKSNIGKNVHIDLITSKDEENLKTKELYYGLNDFSSVVGVLSKKLNFKYGTEGFFKRFKDKKGNWHDILISTSLLDGLKILGFDTNKYFLIKNNDDIVNFVVSSPLLNSSFFGEDALLARDRVSLSRRPRMNYIIDKIKKLNIVASIKDENYFFKKLFPKKYDDYLKISKEIDDKTYQINNKYDGNWLMSKFGIKPGPDVGRLLKLMFNHFKDNLVNANEQDVIDFISNNMK